MKSKPSVTPLVPVLNERGGMEVVLPKINKDCWVERILIVDGHSIDGSVEYAKENGYEVFTQRLKVLEVRFWSVLERLQRIMS